MGESVDFAKLRERFWQIRERERERRRWWTPPPPYSQQRGSWRWWFVHGDGLPPELDALDGAAQGASVRKGKDGQGAWSDANERRGMTEVELRWCRWSRGARWGEKERDDDNDPWPSSGEDRAWPVWKMMAAKTKRRWWRGCSPAVTAATEPMAATTVNSVCFLLFSFWLFLILISDF